MNMTKWNSPELAVASDSSRTRKYRLQQSRWRETVLGVPPGTGAKDRVVSSMLRPEDADRGLQWLTPIIADYVKQRVPQARQEHAAVEEHRLYRNLLSSQPLCFNVFGQLAAFPNATAALLTELLDRPIDSVDRVLVEHTPEPARALGDRSAFDAYLEVTTPQGPEFLGVETKYTEPFSQEPYGSEVYQAVTNDPDGWFLPGSVEKLTPSTSNQLWRTAMLAQLTEQADTGIVAGTVLVLTADEDSGATAAVEAVQPQLKDPSKLHHLTLEDLTATAAGIDDLRGWARLFHARYLD